MSSSSRTRFAPSPTGRLHLGNVRTALFNFLFARSCGGAFVLRIEDTDEERSREDAVAAILADLDWLGLDWDEGPDRGGECGPYRQSWRSTIYDDQLERLERTGHVYPCWRTSGELKAFRRACIASGKPPIYERDWARLPEDEIERRAEAGAKPALRFRVPDTGSVQFDDLVRGPQTFGLTDIGDFVVRRSDGTPAFFFGNAVDDALMGISHVFRGEDHLSNTPRQILLLRAMGMEPPRYGHLPLVVGDDGAPLSKRSGATSLADLRDDGILPAAVANLVARLGHACDRGDLMDMEGLASQFSVARIGRAPARFDPIQLEHWQSLAIQATSDVVLTAWAGEAALGLVPAASRAAFMHWVRPNVQRPDDVARWADILYGEGPRFDPDTIEELRAVDGRFFRIALRAAGEGGHSLAEVSAAVKAVLGVKGRALFRPLRLALTGAGAGPELGPLFDLLPVTTLLSRLGRWAEGTSDSETNDQNP
jgi:glutamyl-tRNA synthetase